jgi:hypothetical protein
MMTRFYTPEELDRQYGLFMDEVYSTILAKERKMDRILRFITVAGNCGVAVVLAWLLKVTGPSALFIGGAVSVSFGLGYLRAVLRG